MRLSVGEVSLTLLGRGLDGRVGNVGQSDVAGAVDRRRAHGPILPSQPRERRRREGIKIISAIRLSRRRGALRRESRGVSSRAVEEARIHQPGCGYCGSGKNLVRGRLL